MGFWYFADKSYLIITTCLISIILGCTKTPETKITQPPTTDEKIKSILNKVELVPSFENYIALGLEYSAAKRSSEALAAFEKAKNINPEAPLSWNNICNEYNVQKKYFEAISSCERAIKLEPNFVLAKNNLRHSQNMLAEYKKQVAEKNKMELAAPNIEASKLIAIGLEFYNLKDYEGANAAWQRIKSTDKQYAIAQNNLASSFILLGQLSAAEKAIKIALKLEPKNKLFLNNEKWLEQVKAKK
ncbi:MAG: hypothetical protein A2Z20_04965 [Bdellovibrionales bacterium RBG_16_40_8]|nr:MAG: hypothetical protein A2Z20_04965 [Bdellovibrionales bacterium RBG_16_40_8]